jgi:hypothetical protein
MTGLARRFRTSQVTLGLFRVLTRRPLRSTISLIRDQNNQNLTAGCIHDPPLVQDIV